jgi:hypothetical protein
MTTIEGFTLTGGRVNSDGGAMYFTWASLNIRSCALIDNEAIGSGHDGGAIYMRNASPRITDCLFSGNTAADKAGAVYCRDHRGSTWIEFERCIFAGNSAPNWIGALLCYADCLCEISSCTFYGNSAPDDAGGIYIGGSSDVTVEHTIVAFSSDGCGVTCESTSDVSLSCTDIYGNDDGDWVGNIAGQYGVNGNFAEDPLFCDAVGGDYQIDACSPCAPSFSPPGCGLVGADSVGCGNYTSVPESGTAVPTAFRLSPPIPNPFNPITTIGFELPKAADVLLTVHDVSGRRVAVLVRSAHEAGSFVTTWDGRDESGREVGSGIYFARLVAGEFTATRKMLLLK